MYYFPSPCCKPISSAGNKKETLLFTPRVEHSIVCTRNMGFLVGAGRLVFPTLVVTLTLLVKIVTRVNLVVRCKITVIICI